MKRWTNSMAAAAAVMVLGAAGTPAAEPLSAVVAVEHKDVFVGEAFQLEIQVRGSEKPQRPDLSAWEALELAPVRAYPNSSRSVTVINGRVTQNIHKGFVFVYRATARTAGTVTLAPVTVRADGAAVRTAPVTLSVRPAAGKVDFLLRQVVSETRCYVGEPVIMTVTWYLDRDVRRLQMRVPALEQDGFEVEDPPLNQVQGRQYLRLDIGGREVIAEKSRARMEGREFATLSFSQVLIATRPGTYTLPPAVVHSEVLVGYRRQASRPGFGDFFSDFFRDDFFGGRQGVYQGAVTTSEPLSIEVLPLPEQGRPANFAGHIGVFRIETAATPTEVNVGDPITLTLAISGPPYLKHVTLPDLKAQSGLAADFKVPDEAAAGKVNGGVKVFTQTLRARHDGVQAIPPVELPYFDTRSGAYRVARSEPIPIRVSPARVVTAADAEGTSPAGAAGQAVEAWSRGIAFNYEGMDVLRDQRFGPETWKRSPLWMVLLLGAPGLYAGLLSVTAWRRRRRADPAAWRSRRALRELRGALGGAAADDPGQVLEALRAYLGAKLGMEPGAITFMDARTALQARGVDAVLVETLRRVFERGEAHRYAGVGAAGDDRPGEEALVLAARLDKVLG